MIEEDWPKLTAGVSKAKDSSLYIDDRAALSIGQIQTTARRAHRRKPLDLIVIDYLQLAKANEKSREREVSVISAGLKALAKELDIPVIALSQLSRDCENRPNKRPRNSDLRDSGSLEQDADMIFFLYRDEVYNPDTAEKGIAEVICSKFRNGAIGTDILASRLNYSRFENTQREYQPPAEEKRNGFDY